MILLLGSGKVYNFVADKLLADCSDDVIQISPEFAGPVKEDSHTKWCKLEDEVDEVNLLLGDVLELKNIVFTKVLLCIPEIVVRRTTLPTSNDLVSLLRQHLCPYLYIAKKLLNYKTRFLVLCEMSGGDEFELDLFCSVIRPLVSVALQGHGTTLEFYSKSMLACRSIEEWYEHYINKGWQ